MVQFLSLQDTLKEIMGNTTPLEFSRRLGYKHLEQDLAFLRIVRDGASIKYFALCNIAAGLRRLPLLLYASEQLMPGRAYEISAGQITGADGMLREDVSEYFAKQYVRDVLRARWQQRGVYLPQSDLSKESGMLVGCLSGWMRGVTRPSTSELAKVGALMGLEVQWLPHADVLVRWQSRLPAGEPEAPNVLPRYLLPLAVNLTHI